MGPDEPTTPSAAPSLPRPGTPGARPEFRSARPWAMEEMIRLEPGLAAQIVADPGAAAIAELIREALDRRDPISVLGSGTSEHAAMVVAALLFSAAPSAAAGSIRSREPLDATLDPWPGLCIAVSHEGGTASTTEALAAARAAGARTALITAAPDGSVAAHADLTLVTPLVDHSWCHTVGYFSPIAAGAAIAAALAGGVLDPTELHRDLDVTLRAAADGAEALAPALAGATRVIPVGSGIDHVAARELALKLEEGAALPAAARDTETLLHGHLAAVDASTAVVFIVTDPRATKRRARRAAQAALALEPLGATVVAILSAEVDQAWPTAWTPAGRIVLPDSAVSGGASTAGTGPVGDLAVAALASAIALQALALAVVHVRGTNPDLIQREHPHHQASADLANGPLPTGPGTR